MKPITALLLLSLAGAGCSMMAPPAGSQTAPAPAAPAVKAGEVKGTLNLNIGRPNDAPGGLNIGASTSRSPGSLIIGPGGAGGNFEDVAGLGIDLQEAPETLPELQTGPDEDDIVRLPGQN